MQEQKNKTESVIEWKKESDQKERNIDTKEEKNNRKRKED